MDNEIQCEIHGARQEAYVCRHLVGATSGLGFNRDEPTEDKPFPDAWCNDCELIRAAHGGWNDKSEKLTTVSLLCSGCYQQAFIRNSIPDVTLDDLADLRWKCGSCDEWHTGPCLDFSIDSPYYWLKEYEALNVLNPSSSLRECPTFLDDDYCAIEGRDYFVRGIIRLPIIGTSEHLCWGVWGSLSHENFHILLKTSEDPIRVELPPMFSWLSSQISEYPETLSLKMYAHVSKPPLCPTFELEPSDHPLAHEYHNGISPERVKEIMLGRLKNNE